MKQNDEQYPIEKLKQDWQQLDELAGHPSLSTIEIKRQLLIQQEKQKKQFYKELLIFFLTALCILSFFVISIVQVPVLFIVIEVCAAVIGPIVFAVLAKKKKQEGKVL